MNAISLSEAANAISLNEGSVIVVVLWHILGGTPGHSNGETAIPGRPGDKTLVVKEVVAAGRSLNFGE